MSRSRTLTSCSLPSEMWMKLGNGSAQVEQRVQLHRRFGVAKLGPGKQRQAQIDGGGIQRIDRLGEIHRKGLLSIEPTRGADQRVGEFGVDAPVARLVGVGQGAAADLAAKTQVVELGGLRAQARLDVAQAFAVGQLCEGHGQKLVQAAEGAHVEIAAIFHHQAAEGMPRRELHELREHEIANVHRCLPGKSRKTAENDSLNSNR